MTCRELTERIPESFENRLSPMARLRFRLHLSRCDRCAEYLFQMKLLVTALGRLPIAPLAPKLRDDLLSAFRRGG